MYQTYKANGSHSILQNFREHHTTHMHKGSQCVKKYRYSMIVPAHLSQQPLHFCGELQNITEVFSKIFRL